MNALYLSKIAPLFVYPLGLALLLAVVALALIGRAGGPARATLGIAILLLWGASTPVVSDAIAGSLEHRFPPMPVTSARHAEAIVVLGGGIAGPQPPRLTADLADAADRVLHGARLYRAGKAPRIILSGGDLPTLGLSASEAPAMRGLLMEWGIPEQALVVEDRSRNTRENAVNTRQVMDELGIEDVLLVTSATHMRRALATFRAAGVDARPVPTDYRVVDRSARGVIDLLPDAHALALTSDALKEYLGFVVYRLKGWIRDGLPSYADA